MITWNTLLDLPTAAAYIKFRITPYDADEGIADTTEFILDNLGVPSLTFNTQITEEQAGDIVFEYTINDDENDLISLSPEYSTDFGNSWDLASTTGDTSDIDSDNYSGSITWLSENDLPGLDLNTVRFRLVPRDTNTGISEATADFHLDNNHIPGVMLASLPGIHKGDITVTYTLNDDENDVLSLYAEYFDPSEASYKDASIEGDTADIGSSGYSGSLSWISFSDL